MANTFQTPTETTTATETAQIDALAADYRSGTLPRREFLARLAIVTGSMAGAHLLLERSGLAQVVSQKEAAAAQISASDVEFPNGDLKTLGYLATPLVTEKVPGPFPAVMVIHENRGLNEHTRDVARRFAGEGFAALAIDLLSRRGGTASMKTPDDARTAIGTISPAEAMSDMEAGLVYLNGLPLVAIGKLASVGFCWGGARSFLLATHNPILKAAVVFYGSAPDAAALADVKCPVLGLYGGDDTRISSLVPEVDKAMKAAGKSYEFKIYDGAGHAFFNDTGANYNAVAAADAWTRALTFLRANLK